MSGQITLGGRTYDNVSGGKFDEIKAILDREDKPAEKKREVREGDVGLHGNKICVAVGTLRNTDWYCLSWYKDNTKKTLFNLLSLVEAMQKAKDGKTELFKDACKRGWTTDAHISGDGGGMVLEINEDRIRTIRLSFADFFELCCQGLGLLTQKGE